MIESADGRDAEPRQSISASPLNPAADRTSWSRRLLIETIGLGLAATVTVLGLRWGMAGTRAVAGPDMPIGYTIASLRAVLRHPSPHDWPMLLVAVLILCGTAVWHRPISRDQGAILAAGVLMAFLSAIGGAAEELRIYIPTITVAIMAGAVVKTEPTGYVLTT